MKTQNVSQMLFLVIAVGLATGCGSDSKDSDNSGAQSLSRSLSCDYKNSTDPTQKGLCLEYSETTAQINIAEHSKSCTDTGGTPAQAACASSDRIGTCRFPTPSSLGITMSFVYYSGTYTAQSAATSCTTLSGTYTAQ